MGRLKKKSQKVIPQLTFFNPKMLQVSDILITFANVNKEHD